MNGEIGRLNERFAAAGRLRWQATPTGLIEGWVEAPACRARLSLNGGQLLEWTPRGAAPVLWLSPRARLEPGRAIRGGVPLCWPWFGPHPRRPDFPAHGFARTARWEPLRACPDGSGVRLTLGLVRDAESYRYLPQAAALTLEMRLGADLELVLATGNEDRRPLILSQALHAYFHVGDARRIRIHGLEGHTYLDKTAAYAAHGQAGPLGLGDGETDRVFLGHRGPVRVRDPVLGREILVEKGGSGSTVVWNPGADKSAAMADMGADAWREMVCIEPANALADARALSPGETQRLALRCRVRPLSSPGGGPPGP